MNQVLSVTLAEYLIASRLCLAYQKDASWPGQGCLGFPAALLLFSVVDTLGSFVEGSDEKFPVSGKLRQIRRPDFEHFFVLNGENYYRQQLEHYEIKNLYDRYRSFLSHHSVFAPGGFLLASADVEVFPRINDEIGVNLVAFYHSSVRAVSSFLDSHPELHASKAARNILRSAG